MLISFCVLCLKLITLLLSKTNSCFLSQYRVNLYTLLHADYTIRKTGVLNILEIPYLYRSILLSSLYLLDSRIYGIFYIEFFVFGVLCTKVLYSSIALLNNNLLLLLYPLIEKPHDLPRQCDLSRNEIKAKCE